MEIPEALVCSIPLEMVAKTLLNLLVCKIPNAELNERFDPAFGARFAACISPPLTDAVTNKGKQVSDVDSSETATVLTVVAVPVRLPTNVVAVTIPEILASPSTSNLLVGAVEFIPTLPAVVMATTSPLPPSPEVVEILNFSLSLLSTPAVHSAIVL